MTKHRFERALRRRRSSSLTSTPTQRQLAGWEILEPRWLLSARPAGTIAADVAQNEEWYDTGAAYVITADQANV